MMNKQSELGQYIPLIYHFQMLTSKERMIGFRNAILETVPQGGRVLELGGGTGVLSFYASHRAAKVWCVERSPALARKARELLEKNHHPGVIEVVNADAMEYLPPEPVDVVICEMLHSALLREKQVEVIDSFKKRYAARFGDILPIFIPEATVLGIQPINQNFNFYDYFAPVPFFENSADPIFAPTSLGAPVVYSIIQYSLHQPESISFNGSISFDQSGEFNAVRFITSNVLAVSPSTKATVNWANLNLIIPLQSSRQVHAASQLKISFDYLAGGSIKSLEDSLNITDG